MPDITYPPDLIAAQTRSHQAWDAVEAHRKQVDAARRDAPRVETKLGPALLPWSAEEDAEHAALMAEATAAAEALHAALAESGLGHGYDTLQGLHMAARAE